MLLVGVGWIVAMTYICYRGIEVSAWFQRILLTIEIIMLLVLSVVALIRVGTGQPPGRVAHPEPQLAAARPTGLLAPSSAA